VKAIVQHEYGAPRDVLRLAEVEVPNVGAEDVLVSVRASSANPWDGPPRAFRTADLELFHAARCRFRYSSWTSCGVL